MRAPSFVETLEPYIYSRQLLPKTTCHPAEIARTPQMINLVSLDGNEPGEPGVLVGKAFSRPGFASGVMHIPPMTAKENANTGSNTLVCAAFLAPQSRRWLCSRKYLHMIR